MTVYDPELLWLAGFTGGGILLTVGLVAVIPSRLRGGPAEAQPPRQQAVAHVAPLRVAAKRVDQVEAA